MGNDNSKKNKHTKFTDDELRILEASYRRAAGNGSLDKLTSDKLVESWSHIIEHELAQSIIDYISSINQEKKLQHITFQQFSEPLYIMERGSLEMKLQMLLASINKEPKENIETNLLEKYIFSVIKSYIRLESTSHCSIIKKWVDIGFTTSDRSVAALARALVKYSGKNLDMCITRDHLEGWLHSTPQFINIWCNVFRQLYIHQSDMRTHRTKELNTNLIPQLCDAPQNSHYRPIIEMPHVLYINSNIPHEFQHKWRFLFSSIINGESFSTMLGKIMNVGPTLILIEDEDQYIFGGYAPDSWALRPQFVGNDSSILFTLSPAMRYFSATGYNNHYQYLNLNQQTMPNGLGMGGQFQYWGLWIDSLFGEGMSAESCSTYSNYIQLSKRKEFKIRNVEVWAVGDLPVKSDDDEGEGTPRSVLDKNLEDRAMLEIAGKKIYSDGLRDPANE